MCCEKSVQFYERTAVVFSTPLTYKTEISLTLSHNGHDIILKRYGEKSKFEGKEISNLQSTRMFQVERKKKLLGVERNFAINQFFPLLLTHPSNHLDIIPIKI
jgi:hypothetical protein